MDEEFSLLTFKGHLVVTGLLCSDVLKQMRVWECEPHLTESKCKHPIDCYAAGLDSYKYDRDQCKQSAVAYKDRSKRVALFFRSEIFIPAWQLIRWDSLFRWVSVKVAVIRGTCKLKQRYKRRTFKENIKEMLGKQQLCWHATLWVGRFCLTS